jgi:hypothetical protein
MREHGVFSFKPISSLSLHVISGLHWERKQATPPERKAATPAVLFETGETHQAGRE